MQIWEAILLGIIQGLTEFLPVSSSGHLVIFQDLLGVAQSGVTFEVAVHVGTALAVAFYFRNHLWQILKNLRLLSLLVVASIPAAVLGIFAEDFLTGLFSQTLVVGVALLFTGGILWYAEKKTRQDASSKNFPELSYADAFFIGFGQALAIVPGISRSGSTISAGLFRDVRRETAAEFSFLMSVPVILGAALLELPNLEAASAGLSLGPVVVGTVFSFLSGLFAIYFLLAVIRRYSLTYFSYYTWFLGAIVILLNLL
ncbi:MAG: undecaprenyl-diphosphate phosphatase [Firmicutes bacterium]|nr:undecaprenyl-diphosphate phosphatase [Bacillota bacterium]